MGEETVQAVVEDFYRSRLANDPARCVAHFDPQASLRIVGLSDYGTHGPAGKPAKPLLQIYTELAATWEWLSMEIDSLTIQGERAVVHFRLETRFTLTGEVLHTELMDLFTVRHGRIASIVEFVDTARAIELAQRVQAAPGGAA